jgi:hypothetical protein
VPNFTAILIHEGNDADDSEGCILVGRKRETDFIGESKLALKAPQDKLDRTKAAGEAIAITITSPAGVGVRSPTWTATAAASAR